MEKGTIISGGTEKNVLKNNAPSKRGDAPKQGARAHKIQSNGMLPGTLPIYTYWFASTNVTFPLRC